MSQCQTTQRCQFVIILGFVFFWKELCSNGKRGPSFIPGVKKFHSSLCGHTFEIYTDFKSPLRNFSNIKPIILLIFVCSIAVSWLMPMITHLSVARNNNSQRWLFWLTWHIKCQILNCHTAVLMLKALPHPLFQADQITRLPAWHPKVTHVLNWLYKGWSVHGFKPFKTINLRNLTIKFFLAGKLCYCKRSSNCYTSWNIRMFWQEIVFIG